MFKGSPAQRLLQDIKSASDKRNAIPAEVSRLIVEFKQRFLRLKPLPDESSKRVKQEIYDALIDFSGQYKELCTFTDEELGRFEIKRKGGSSSFSDSSSGTTPEIVAFRQKFSMHFVCFLDTLKTKIEHPKYQKKALGIYDEICKHANPLEQEPTEKNLKIFKDWLRKFLLQKENDFKETPWIWYDVLKPMLMGFLGVIITLVTLVVRPFVPEVAQYADSFFIKRTPPILKGIQDESEVLLSKIEPLVPVLA